MSESGCCRETLDSPGHLQGHIFRPKTDVLLLLPSRCFGGEVSWDKSVCIGSTYEVTDESITHQVVDRPNIDKQYINR